MVWVTGGIVESWGYCTELHISQQPPNRMQYINRMHRMMQHTTYGHKQIGMSGMQCMLSDYSACICTFTLAFPEMRM